MYVLFLSIFLRFGLRALFIYLSLDFSIALYQLASVDFNFNIVKGLFLKTSFASAALTNNTFDCFIPIYILKDFTEGFVHITFA